MSKLKWTAANFSFYDREAIEQKLERMSAEGWQLVKAGNFFWTWQRAEPQKLRFAVTYFPGASAFDGAPGEKQLEKEALCAEDGWRLVLRRDAMQIFCTDRADAAPVDTDPVPQVANMSLTMRKKLPGQLLSAAMVAYALYLQVSQLRSDPAEYLSDTGRLFAIPVWLLLLLLEAYDIIALLLWARQAKKAASLGVYLPLRSQWLPWAIVILAGAMLFFFRSAGGNHLLSFCVLASVAIPMLLGGWMLGALRRRGVRRGVNLAVSCTVTALLVAAGMFGTLAAGISGLIPMDGQSEPVDYCEWHGELYEIYDDPLPLEVEDIADVDARWSKEARYSESPLLAHGEYRQSLLYTEDAGGYELSFEITDVKVKALYGFVRDLLLASRQDRARGGSFEPVDPGPWRAEEAYRLHRGGVSDTYLVCRASRLVEITFSWTPSASEIQAAAEILAPAE